ncbi:MAG: hypothetical protein OEY33_02845 [Bdellovibrionales bacterium]|nr:hypothetical protein [Bdellovibrionales bacterium]
MFRNITSLIFLLLWGLQAKASYPTYVGDKKLSVSTQSFNRYIKPQLKNLYNEYFYLVDTLAGKRSRSVELYHSIKKLEESWNDWINVCSAHKEDCSDVYKKMKSSQQKTEKILLKILADEKKVKSLEKLNELSSLNFSLRNRILAFKDDIFRFPKRWKKETTIISGILNRMSVYSEMILTKDINSSFKEDFDYVWVHFFKKISLDLLKDKKPGYLVSRLEELNWAWNTFHMKISKGQKSFDRKLLNTIKIMHSRWNSVLKIILNS